MNNIIKKTDIDDVEDTAAFMEMMQILKNENYRDQLTRELKYKDVEKINALIELPDNKLKSLSSIFYENTTNLKELRDHIVAVSNYYNAKKYHGCEGCRFFIGSQGGFNKSPCLLLDKGTIKRLFMNNLKCSYLKVQK